MFVAVAVFLGTHLPPSQVPGFVWHLAPDKVWHAAAYGSLAFLLYGGLRLRFQRRSGAFLSVLLLAAVFSGVDELTQPLTGRNRELLDFLASSGGAVLGAIAAVLVGSLLRTTLKP